MVCCRQIVADDGDAVIDLLTRGFDRRRDYWEMAFDRLRRHNTPDGYPKYGYLLETEGRLVGVLLLIYTKLVSNGEARVRCNVSSWYVEPAYRCFATILSQCAARERDVTYVNISPAPHTWPILEAQRYKPFANGRFLSLPLLAARTGSPKLHRIGPTGIIGQQNETALAQALPQAEIDLLTDHARYGCLSVVGESKGQFYPFVFGLHRRHGVKLANLVYCHDVADLSLFALPLGWLLAKHGCFLLVTDADHKLARLPGLYRDGVRRYMKGPNPLHLGDLAYCEQVMFGY